MYKPVTTQKEIAKRLNISVATVSRALHNHPAIGLRTKANVQKLARDLNYECNQTALYFKEQKTYTIGVILPNLKEEFFSQAINAIEDEANKNNYSVLIGQSHDNVEKEKQIIKTMRNHRVDGLIMSISKETTQYRHIIDAEKYNIPVVFFDRVPDLNTVHKVSSDLSPGTHTAISFLIGRGHKRIGVINGPMEMRTSRERLEAYMEIMKKKRRKIDMLLVETSDLTNEGTTLAMKTLLDLKYPPTAILTFNDYVALDAIRYARKRGLNINKDLCFVSYANLPITSYLEFPPMASVEQYPYDQAKKATEILFDLLQDSNIVQSTSQQSYRNILIKGDLIFHDS